MIKNGIDYTKVGHRIKFITQTSNMSNSELAKKLNIEEASLLSIYAGSNVPSSELLLLISDALNTPIDFFLTDALDNKTKSIDYTISLMLKTTYFKDVNVFIEYEKMMSKILEKKDTKNIDYETNKDKT